MNDGLMDGLRIAAVGVGATAFMDLWLMGLKRAGIPGLNFALLGRWVGHGLRGRWRHAGMAGAAPVAGERALGWLSHYAVGVLFAGLLVLGIGRGWLQEPRPWPALVVGFATLAAPLLLMQPAMGAGLAYSKTPAPLRQCLKSALNHLVFGLGLFLSASLLARLG